jgi:Zn-dependent membrane protease YugP
LQSTADWVQGRRDRFSRGAGILGTLEDWFDPRRLRDDYVPTGFKGYGVKTRAVPGHEFGLKLRPQEKEALVAFLKTL